MRVRKAFTLVEILIVVVILGILAAIVVPQFTNATQDAQAGNIQTQLDTINNQIELFAARNNGVYPDFAGTGWAEMVGPPVAGTNHGGYLKEEPSNPACPDVAARELVEVGPAAATCGWHWELNQPGGVLVMKATYFDEATGKITTTP
ncbi:MAG: prepilin-type N-terminal cleavage/methylation domain-containing protein [Phycisphaerales bacterium]|nr:prepilin-type N-terminal cleavage/methylation domain-containing protein [Phycisphaerales bacterium]